MLMEIIVYIVNLDLEENQSNHQKQNFTRATLALHCKVKRSSIRFSSTPTQTKECPMIF